MIIARNASELRRAIATLRAERGQSLAFVPTMGSLHEGHLSLIDAARSAAATTVASVYVNPTQFAAGEDLDSYPRNPEADSELLESRGCDILFLPRDSDIYPAGFGTSVLADHSLTNCLCGTSRGQQHFDGVVTVVARLFGLVEPTVSLFGEKDWQQLLVIKRMSADLHPWLTVTGVPTARDLDGLALSSRNAYLSEADRFKAAAIPAAIREVQLASQSASQSSGSIEELARTLLELSGLEVDYCEVRRASTLEAPDSTQDLTPTEHRIFIAATVGRTRLIDNASLAESIDLRSSLQNPKSQGASTASAAATSAA